MFSASTVIHCYLMLFKDERVKNNLFIFDCPNNSQAENLELSIILLFIQLINHYIDYLYYNVRNVCLVLDSLNILYYNVRNVCLVLDSRSINKKRTEALLHGNFQDWMHVLKDYANKENKLFLYLRYSFGSQSD